MRVAHVVPSLEVRHGGPSKSVRALASAMAGLGNTTRLLTTHEAGQEVATESRDDRVRPEFFPRVFPRALCRSPGLRQRLLSGDENFLHHHSLWLLTLRYTREAAAARDVPFVISPRGMFSGWAYDHRRLRKWLASHLVHPGAFAEAAGWHATSDEEAESIRRLGFRQPVCVAPNGVHVPTTEALEHARTVWQGVCPAITGRRVALFYSRFHRKKRLRELIDLWAAQAADDWFLLIAGVPEEFAVDEVRSWITQTGAQDRMAVIDGAGRPPPFAAASLFLLPSHSENFGLVVAEALAAGVPALVTDTTPWGGLHHEDAGWCVPWEEFPGMLRQARAAGTDELAARGARGRAWVSRAFTWSGAAQRLSDFYRNLSHG